MATSLTFQSPSRLRVCCPPYVRFSLSRDFYHFDDYLRQGWLRPFHVTSKRLIPQATELEEPGPECDAGPASWTFGVQSTKYFRYALDPP